MPTFMLKKLDMPSHRQLAITEAAHIFNVEYSFAKELLALWEIQMMGVMFENTFPLKNKSSIFVERKR